MHAPLPLLHNDQSSLFQQTLEAHGKTDLDAASIDTLQVNLGKRCNQACHHCHVDAGPNRTEDMSSEVADLVIDVLRRHRFETLDITGGAPEIHRQFKRLAVAGATHCRRVIDRSNLTIFFEPDHEDLPQFLARHNIDIVASLPCYEMTNVDQQRGIGVFDKSIRALQMLNDLGYGAADGRLKLDLVFNPTGPHLPPDQPALESEYKHQLHTRFGIRFNRLLTITNMPISRFRHDLERRGTLHDYMKLLQDAFNPGTIGGLMCRSMVSVGFDGALYDCDFNQMLDLKVHQPGPQHIRDFDAFVLARRRVRTGTHCFGCTAGPGSSCGGAVLS